MPYDLFKSYDELDKATLVLILCYLMSWLYVVYCMCSGGLEEKHTDDEW